MSTEHSRKAKLFDSVAEEVIANAGNQALPVPNLLEDMMSADERKIGERKIGERFKDGDMELEVVETLEIMSCRGCAYEDLPAQENDGDGVICFTRKALAVHGNCLKSERSDQRSVIFRKV